MKNIALRLNFQKIEMGRVIANPQITKKNTEALCQTFDSEGNSDLKLIIKID